MNKYTLKPTPMFHEYQLYGNQEAFIKRVIQDKKLDIYIRNNTKTTLNVSFQSGKDLFGVNQYEIDGFKFHKAKRQRFIDFEIHTYYYFKWLKSQGQDKLMKYLDALIEKIFGDVHLDCTIYTRLKLKQEAC